MPRFLVRVLVTSCLWGVLLLVLSWPLLGALHARLGLSAPPLSGLLLLGGGIIIALGGGAAIGHGIGQWGGRNPVRLLPLLAAVSALAWGIGVVATVAPLYAGTIADAMTRDGTALLWGERSTLASRTRDVTGRIRRGESRQAATEAAREVYNKAKPLALRGAAMVPALLLLLWAVIIPPFLGAWECYQTRR